jgi:prepilin-type N-terminal cleavage/methylation domain-containing protein/prepilin-type processing-associated H-X9-DG protein
MKQGFRPHPRCGFTLIEMLVVIAIIGVLIALLVPAVQKVREAANRIKCQNNMKQIGVALHNYHTLHMVLPSGGELRTNFVTLGWTVFILPYVEQDPLYRQFDLTLAWNDTSTSAAHPVSNKELARNAPALYYCPSANITRPVPIASGPPASEMLSDGTFPATGHYYGVCGPLGDQPSGIPYPAYTHTPGAGQSSRSGTLFPNSTVLLEWITDGTSNTIVVGELSYDKAKAGYSLNAGRDTGYRTWTRGANGTSSPDARDSGMCKTVVFAINAMHIASNNGNGINHMSFGSNHPFGCNFLFGDGSVRFIDESLNINVLRYLSSRESGETFELP